MAIVALEKSTLAIYHGWDDNNLIKYDSENSTKCGNTEDDFRN